uniref:Uncharacterized protein n=1 Tax=Pipistrellus kuhlii TaxID=59472 RepID=A0A7J7UTS6_PIPKU|nr:hypothetical protein mPipKuh1_008693 [Pipistrellus kuhlii]
MADGAWWPRGLLPTTSRTRPSPCRGAPLLPFGGASARDRGLWRTPPTSPAVYMPRGSWAAPGCPCVSPGPQDVPLLRRSSVQSQLLALPPPGQGLKEASPPAVGTARKDEATQDRRLLAARMARAQRLTFYRRFCTFVEECVTSPSPVRSFLLFCKK